MDEGSTRFELAASGTTQHDGAGIGLKSKGCHRGTGQTALCRAGQSGLGDGDALATLKTPNNRPYSQLRKFRNLKFQIGAAGEFLEFIDPHPRWRTQTLFPKSQRIVG